jgi:16S rRNA (cytidine1402-2'-O)-methyltransferase
LVRLAHENHIRVVPIPGACAVIAAICVSGLPTNRFTFEGFLPAKVTARQSHLNALKSEERTLIFYEAPHRLLATLKDLGEIFGHTRHAVLARELTKTFETIQYGELQYLLNFVENDANQQRGEIVIIVAGKEKTPKNASIEISTEAKAILAVLLEELPVKQAANLTAKITGERKRELYNYGLTLQ